MKPAFTLTGRSWRVIRPQTGLVRDAEGAGEVVTPGFAEAEDAGVAEAAPEFE